MPLVRLRVISSEKDLKAPGCGIPSKARVIHEGGIPSVARALFRDSFKLH